MLKKFFAGCLVWASLITSASALDVKLTWNPNTESDLAGYKVYRGTTLGGPYGNLGQVILPEYVWVVPDDTEEMNYFRVTAFDTAGNESAFSNEVSVYVDNKSPKAPLGLQIIIVIIPSR